MDWEVKEISGDGSCLFSAVADQLYDDPRRQKEVRALVYEKMSKNRGKYQEFFTDDANGDEANSAKELNLLNQASQEAVGSPKQTELLRQAWEISKQMQDNNEQESFVTHLNKLRLNGSWGSEPDIKAIQDATGIPIEVYSREKNGQFTLIPSYTAAPEGKTPIRLLFTGNHYDSIRDPAITYPLEMGSKGPVGSEEDILVSLLTAAGMIELLLLQLRRNKRVPLPKKTVTEEGRVTPESETPGFVEQAIAGVASMVGTKDTDPKQYFLPINATKHLYLIAMGANCRLLTDKDNTGPPSEGKTTELLNKQTLDTFKKVPAAPKAKYGTVKELKYTNFKLLDLNTAGTWINCVNNTGERGILRKLLRALKIKIVYPTPTWAATILNNPTMCDSFKDRVRTAIRLSNEHLAEDDTDTMKELQRREQESKEKNEKNPYFPSRFRNETIVVNMPNSMKQTFTVPNPYRSSAIRNTYTNTTFANPTGQAGNSDVPGRNRKLMENLIPAELRGDSKIVRAILEGLWFCGQHPDSRLHPGCFMTRFLGELRMTQKMSGVDALIKTAERIAKDGRSVLSMIQKTDSNMDLRKGVGIKDVPAAVGSVSTASASAPK